MTFEIKVVDIGELKSKLTELKSSFQEMLEKDLNDNQWYEIFDTVSGRKETI